MQVFKYPRSSDTYINVVHSFAAGIWNTAGLRTDIRGIAREISIFCPVVVAFGSTTL